MYKRNCAKSRKKLGGVYFEAATIWLSGRAVLAPTPAAQIAHTKQKPPRAVGRGAVRIIQLRISPGSPRSRW